jgi:hypothetical protein
MSEIIKTKYLGATNYKGARVSATNLVTKKRAIVAWNSKDGPLEMHERAAHAVTSDGHTIYDVGASTTDGYLFVAREGH